jgi:hypothetical protein
LINNGYYSYNPIFKTFPTPFIGTCIITFAVSLLVYGFRASLVSFSGLLAMVIALAIQKKQRMIF